MLIFLEFTANQLLHKIKNFPLQQNSPPEMKNLSEGEDFTEVWSPSEEFDS
jgi:hypothetical protein